MARRSRDDLLLLGISLLRYNRVGYGFAFGQAAGWASQPLSNLVAELADGGQLLHYPSPSTIWCTGGLLTWWNIRVLWVCAEECT
eukprot:1409379-Pyramimonas_sp.AAC.2